MSTWYSALELAIEQSLPTNKNNSVKQSVIKDWLNAKSREGLLFKAQELEWSGLNTWLELQPDLVSKESVLAYLKDNGVKISEVHYGLDHLSLNMQKLNDAGYTFDRGMDDDVYLYDKNGELVDTELLPEDLDIAYQNITGQIESDTKYEKYTVPGGNNYKELLLILPDAQSNSQEGRVTFKHPDDVDGFLTDLSIQGYENLDYGRVDDGIHKEYVEFSGLTRSELNSFKKIADHNNGSLDFTSLDGGAPLFRMGHFEQANILAHIRFNEHIDPHGKRILFINEIQSDWGQEGRKKGFKPNNLTADEKELQRLNGFTYQRDLTPEERELHTKLKEKGVGATLLEKVKNAGTVPNAPFVTKTDAWVSLAVKRMMHYAAENNFHTVAFINGQQAVDLYDLTKQIEEVRAFKNNDGTFNIDAWNKGTAVLEQENLTNEQLANSIGKELAEKIINESGKDVSGHENGKSYTGVDLRVGGEGMLTFYNFIIPKVTKDLLKKVGGELSTITLDVSETIKLSDMDAKKRFDEGKEVFYFSDDDDELMVELSDVEDFEDFFLNHDFYYYGETEKQNTQVAFNITPEMQKTILKGLPLFRLQDRNKSEQLMLSDSDIQNEIVRIQEMWPGLPNVVLIHSTDDLPFIAPAHTQAAAYDDKIYLVTSNVYDLKDVQLAIGHEAIGHIAFANLFESEREFGEFLFKVMAAAQKEGSKLNELLQEVEDKYPNASVETKAKELIALAVEHCLDINGDLDIELSLIKSVYAKAASFVRSIGLDIPFSNFELQGLILDAGRLLTDPPQYSKTLESLTSIDVYSANEVALADRDGGFYRGSVSQITPVHVVQNIGKNVHIAHDKRDLSKSIKRGGKYSIKYENKRAVPINIDRSTDKSLTI
ncbi:MAG: hypothetical protein Q8N30_04015 [Methylococcales bacterium]|nr:hypothetical protein [Methylococcales bacterium]